MKKNYKDESNGSISQLSKLWPQYQHVDLVACTTLKIQSAIILTAYNPMGVNLSRRINQHHSLLLQCQIRRLGMRHQMVWGRAVDGWHAELSFALDCSLARGLRLANQWQQLAIYEVRSNHLYLHDCQRARQPVLVGEIHRFWKVDPICFKALCQRF